MLPWIFRCSLLPICMASLSAIPPLRLSISPLLRINSTRFLTEIRIVSTLFSSRLRLFPGFAPAGSAALSYHIPGKRQTKNHINSTLSYIFGILKEEAAFEAPDLSFQGSQWSLQNFSRVSHSLFRFLIFQELPYSVLLL